MPEEIIDVDTSLSSTLTCAPTEELEHELQVVHVCLPSPLSVSLFTHLFNSHCSLPSHC